MPVFLFVLFLNSSLVSWRYFHSKNCSCSYGIHLAHKNWALLFGKSWSDMAIIECETDIKNIVVSTDCDGKLRTSKIKVIRELPESEY